MRAACLSPPGSGCLVTQHCPRHIATADPHTPFVCGARDPWFLVSRELPTGKSSIRSFTRYLAAPRTPAHSWGHVPTFQAQPRGKRSKDSRCTLLCLHNGILTSLEQTASRAVLPQGGECLSSPFRGTASVTCLGLQSSVMQTLAAPRAQLRTDHERDAELPEPREGEPVLLRH